jgi:hypothetical protein
MNGKNTKGNRHPRNDLTINPSGNESIRDVIANTGIGRRRFMRSTLSASVVAAIAGAGGMGFTRSTLAAPIPPSPGFGGIGFDSIPPNTLIAPPNPGVADAVAVPPGYTVEVLVAWGDPIVPGGPGWNEAATQTAHAQERQFGMHCDGMYYFPFPARGGPSSTRGILCVNNEYTHEEILHGPDGLAGGAGVTIGKVRKSQAAHGVSICEVVKSAGRWRVNVGSAFGRRITANTKLVISGPAAGHALLMSKKFNITPIGSIHIGTNDGHTGYGTANNCANGYTPWGTYLTCEENWNGYFGWNAGDPEPANSVVLNDQRRYGISAGGFGYRWHEVDPRFNARTNFLEPYHFGWVVEIDPFDPKSVPVKRTALGRFKHESAQVAVGTDAAGTPNRVAFYMGDDERNEYVYKFVCARAYDPNNRAANRKLLDHGTLYAARFTGTPVPGKPATFRGVWLPLTPDAESVIDNPNLPGTKLKLRELPQFAGADDTEVQALILLKTRQAADALGATMMDRPEWTAVRTYNGFTGYDVNRPLEVYCALTNNSRRGNTPASSNNPNGTTASGSANPPVDPANPRPDNDFGHIIRWREDGNHVTATGFEWDIFVLAGDAVTTKALGGSYNNANLVDGMPGVGPFYQGNIVDNPNGSADLGAPDGLWFDQFGRLWIQTDHAGNGAGDFINIGSNVMAAADPNTGEFRRFLTSPNHCEVTGMTNTPDGRTMFVGIQHPGEDSGPANPTQFSNWPQAQFATNSAGKPLPNTSGLSRPRSAVLVITRNDGGIIGA